MHKSLLIPEIISGVCSELYSAYDSYPGTLAAFAVTCQAISEPALDVLWHTHGSIIPLLRCMSDDLWNDSVEFNRNNHLVCRRILIILDFCLRASHHIHYIVSRKTDTTHRLAKTTILRKTYQSPWISLPCPRRGIRHTSTRSRSFSNINPFKT